jgi:hypothetical protein
MKSLLKLALVAAALVLSGTAMADQPFGTLTFDQPTGTVAANQAIPIWVTVKLDADSAPLSLSSSSLSGLDLATAPTDGAWYDSDGNQHLGTITTFTGAYLNTFFGCSGTFTNVCSPSTNYEFNFHLASNAAGPSINFLTDFDLQAGQSYSYLFGEFDPIGGMAAPGTYTFFYTGLTLNYTGTDVDGNVLTSTVDIATTCGTADCEFTRTVTGVSSVPEPDSLALMGLGMLVVAAVVRRRRA